MTEKIDFTGEYVRRIVDDELDELVESLPALLIDGPKGAGKTATATERADVIHRLDNAPEAELFAADPARVLRGSETILIDEWHRVPAAWDAVRRAVDERPSRARFLLTGSAPSTESHSGAARIANVRLRPLILEERLDVVPTVSLGAMLSGELPPISGESPIDLEQYVDEIVAGGYPGMRHLSDRALRLQLDSYVARIVDHDMPMEGYSVRRPDSVYAWMRSYAAATSTTTSFEKIRKAATTDRGQVGQATATSYVELLKALRILDPVEAWIPSRNHLRSLTQSPKHHLVDPALAVRLVDLDVEHLLAGESPGSMAVRDGTFLGALFESLVAMTVRVLGQSLEARVRHLRLQGGRHEVDFIVEKGARVMGIEVKLSASVSDADVKHLLWLRETLGDECVDLAVITTGPAAYRRRDGVAVVPLALLGR